MDPSFYCYYFFFGGLVIRKYIIYILVYVYIIYLYIHVHIYIYICGSMIVLGNLENEVFGK